MATESNKRTALAEFKDRHKHVHFMLVEEDTLHLRVNGLVAGTRNIPLHYLAKGVFHPIAAYTRSITRVFRRSKAFADKLFSFEEEHRNKPLESAGNLLGVQYDALLDSYESYLFALEGLFEDLASIASCFWADPPKRIRSDAYRRFKIELEAMSSTTAYVVNKIKHNQAMLGGFHSIAANPELRLAVPGFMLVRAIGDGAGADPDFPRFENSAISFFSDFRRTLTSVVAASEALSDFLEEVNVEQDRSGPIGPKWNDVPDTVFSLSRLAHPSELHEFVFERISFDPFPIKREPMIGSIRYGSPPSDLACGERMLMFEGDGYTRSYNLPRPLQMHPTDKPEVVASITSRI